MQKLSKSNAKLMSRLNVFNSKCLKLSESATNNNIKSFEEIPGPLSLPGIGTLYLYLPFIGGYSTETVHKNALKNYKLYGPIIREQIVPGRHVVYLADPDDIAKMYQSEGGSPRRNSHKALEKYRLDRPHLYNSGGLLSTNGEKWSTMRKTFQKGLSSPSDAQHFLKSADKIITEWIDTRIKNIQDDTTIDYLTELSRLYLELLGVVAFDTRLNSFSESGIKADSRTSKLLESALVSNSTIFKGDMGPQLWRKFDTPVYKQLKKAQAFMEKVAIDLIISKMSTLKEKTQEFPTLIERYLSSNSVDLKDIIGVACDFLLAGMDTTTYSTSFLLYHLAKNPQQQELLFQETCRLLPKISDSVTLDIYKKAEYTKACLKESLRLMPISVGVGRILASDLVLSGYSVPKDTIVVTLNQIMCRQEKYFTQPDAFQPERWIKGSVSYKPIHPYLVTPFGHGQRSCIARRLAEQNMVLTTLKLLRRYKLEWKGSDLDCLTIPINKPNGPILLKLTHR